MVGVLKISKKTKLFVKEILSIFIIGINYFKSISPFLKIVIIKERNTKKHFFVIFFSTISLKNFPKIENIFTGDSFNFYYKD